MKRNKLENELKKLGWWFLRHGGNHDIWTNEDRQEPIPRHSEINEKLAVRYYVKQRDEANYEIFR